MPNTSLAFATLHPALHLALQTVEGQALLRDYPLERFGALQGTMTDHSARLAEGELAHAARTNTAGANAWEALNIPNGEFTVRTSEASEAFRFLIYTVRQGTLAGKRVVKIEDPRGPGQFRAIAFLTPEGDFQVWTRFRRNENSVKFVIARRLVDGLRNLTISALTSGQIPNNFSITRGNPVTGERAVTGTIVEHRLRCVICNTPVNDRSGGLACSDHWPAEPVVREPDPELERLLAEEAEIERITRANEVNQRTFGLSSHCLRSELCDRPARHPGRCNRNLANVVPSLRPRREPVVIIGDFPTQRTVPLVMCEIGTGQIR